MLALDQTPRPCQFKDTFCVFQAFELFRQSSAVFFRAQYIADFHCGASLYANFRIYCKAGIQHDS